MNSDKFEKLNAQLKLDKVPKFTQLRIETSNICEYNCFMCPRRKMTRKLGIMTLDDLRFIVDCFDYIKYDLDFHLHGYGESLICDDLPERCKLITARKPNFTPFIISTLGCKRDRKWLESLFENGLSKVIVSLYGYDLQTYKNVHGVDKFDLVKENLEFIVYLQNRYHFELTVQLDQFEKNYPLPQDYTHGKVERLRTDFTKYLKDIGVRRITAGTLHNFGDGFENLSTTTLKKKVPCSIIWGNRRQHISISWDLNVHPCCYDYNCSVIWGNLRKNTLEEIYKSFQRISFIKSLLNLENINKPAICSTNSCYPQETHHDKEYTIVEKFMEV